MGIAARLGAQRPESALDVNAVFGRSKFLIPRRLGRADSICVSRSRAPGSPGRSRSEPLLRGSFREKVDYSNLNCRPDRKGHLRAGLRKKPRVRRQVSRHHGAPQFPLHPYSARRPSV